MGSTLSRIILRPHQTGIVTVMRVNESKTDQVTERGYKANY